ncbi:MULTISPECIES: CHY zinc finger protein [Corynebacterium]|uniref:CHY zinc finger protein n=1 Tax=Corynebacterium nasicanis TaxID=1448267 RepID=A0ABW1QFM2_9CORY|nr:CHY zinc finger protein [Corynebacterium sp.]MDO5669942.1 CHY zinc finger protein [Corynebacterium sp.]
MSIRGVGVDAQGRCAHYRSDRDVVANRCATCGDYWACHACHAELADHPFGRMPLVESGSVMCGVCAHGMDYAAYSAATACPQCRHPFNAGCAAHASLYFLI